MMTTKYSAMSTLQEILSYRVEGSPLPLIVAAAGPRARLAGEQVAVLLLPGAATSLHGDAATGLRTTPATQLRRTVAPSTSHKTPAFTCSSDPLSGLAASVVDDSHLHYCRVVRGSSLEGVTAAMCEAARWYGRPATSTPADPALEASYHLANEDDGEEAGSAVSSGRVKNGHIDVFVPSGLPSAANYQSLCVPLCLEVVAPRLILPAATARHTCADGAAVVRLWRKAQLSVGGVLRVGRNNGGAATSRYRRILQMHNFRTPRPNLCRWWISCGACAGTRWWSCSSRATRLW